MKNYNELWNLVKSSHSRHPSVRFRNYFIIRMVKRILDPQVVNTILDVGCGNGELLKQLNGQGIILSGCDISEYQIEENKLRRMPVNFWVADFNKKVESNDKFNFIICSEVIEHLNNWKLALRNIANMYELGGYLILTTQSGRRFRSDSSVGHLEHFKLDYLANYLKTLNYDILIAEKRGFPFYNLQKIADSILFPMSKKFAYAEVNTLKLILFNITYFLFRISIKSKRLGPQIFILARKIV